MEILSQSDIVEFESLNTYRHNNAKPPKQAYLYFPTERETVEFDKNNPKKILRRIFQGGLKYTSFESDNLNNFENFLMKNQLILPEYWKRYDTLRFLQANGYDHDKTLKYIKDHIEWRTNNLPVIPTDNVKKILKLGFFYIHGRDNRFRPIIVLNPDIFVNNLNNYVLNDWVYSLIFVLEYLKEHCFLPGQIENWNLICDVGKSSILFIPKEFNKLLNILQSNYRCRLYKMYILNVSLFIKVLWKTINIMFDPTTQRKIKLLQEDSDIEQELFKYINKTQIEKRFGGTADNIESKFFPPIFPSNEYITSKEVTSIFVDENEYLEIINSNKEYRKSPFISNESNVTNLLSFKESFNTVLNEKSEISIYEDAKSIDVSVRAEKTKRDEISINDNTFSTIRKNEKLNIDNLTVLEDSDFIRVQKEEKNLLDKDSQQRINERNQHENCNSKFKESIILDTDFLEREENKIKLEVIPESVINRENRPPESDTLNEECSIEFQNNEYPLPKRKIKFSFDKDQFRKHKNSRNLKKETSKILDISTKPDDYQNNKLISSQQLLINEKNRNTKIEGEEPKITCCSNILDKSNSKCILY